MNLTVIAPSYNDKIFIKAWLVNVSKLNPAQILIADTGSTDGSLEFFRKQSGITLIDKFKTSHRFDWNEAEVRNYMLNIATGDVILSLDMDELIGTEFTSVLTDFSRNNYLIGRLIEYKFWNDLRHLRKRSLKPLFRDGKIGWLSNWRGAYPTWHPRLFKRCADISYKGKIHPVPQFKDYGRWSYYIPGITKNYGCGFYHYHFAFPAKPGEDRYRDRFDKVKLIEFKGQHPEEIKFFGSL